MSARLYVRAAAGGLVLAFYVWLWSQGVIRSGSLGWTALVPLFLLGYLAYAFLAHLGEAAVEGRELGLRDEATERPL